MESSRSSSLSPDPWSVGEAPSVDDARPSRCSACSAPARKGSRVILHGHGLRTRWVVVPPAVEAEACPVELVECWQRRYRCTACRAVTVVLPRGVLPRFLYSVAAIVVGLFLVTAEPIGGGLSDAEAYARQGMFARLSTYAEMPYRWRSVDRWAARAKLWWSGWTGTIAALLVLFTERARSRALAAAVRIAILSHVRWGAAR